MTELLTAPPRLEEGMTMKHGDQLNARRAQVDDLKALNAQLLKALKESADLAWDISHKPLSGSDQTRLATIRWTLVAAIRAAEEEK